MLPSMSSLHPCQHCQRHIRASESACPFCSARVGSRPLAKAALLATALAGASTLGCADKKSEPAQIPTSVPVTAPVSDAMSATPADAAVAIADAGAPDSGVPDAAVAKKKKKKHEVLKVEEPQRVLPPMPYGAPPARRRLV